MKTLRDVRLSTNPDPRCLCVLLLDTSDSMNQPEGDKPINRLNEGLRTLQMDLLEDPLARRRVELALVTFGKGGVQVAEFELGHAKLITELGIRNELFVEARDFIPPTLSADNGTPMSSAIHKALDLVRDRKDQYDSEGLPYYRPWVFMITDGQPTDPPNEVESAAKRVHETDNEEAKGVVFYAVGVPPQVDMGTLARISVRQPTMLQGAGSFKALFLWLSRSQRMRVHEQVGTQHELDRVEIGG